MWKSRHIFTNKKKTRKFLSSFSYKLKSIQKRVWAREKVFFLTSFSCISRKKKKNQFSRLFYCWTSVLWKCEKFSVCDFLIFRWPPRLSGTARDFLLILMTFSVSWWLNYGAVVCFSIFLNNFLLVFWFDLNYKKIIDTGNVCLTWTLD